MPLIKEAIMGKCTKDCKIKVIKKGFTTWHICMSCDETYTHIPDSAKPYFAKTGLFLKDNK